MAQISSIGSGVYTSMDYLASTVALDETTVEAAFAVTDAALPVSNVREFPTFGTPANIVNVPVYGSPTSLQVSAQADAPTLEITLNYVPNAAVGPHTALEALRAAGTVHTFRISLQNEQSGTDISSFYFNASCCIF